MVLHRPAILLLGQRSLVRGIALSLGAFGLSLWLAGFPVIANLHGSPWQACAVAAAACGLAETARCLGRRWNLYHAGVLILIYSELMILAMAVVLWALL